MEKLLKFLSHQNKYFEPDDELTELVSATLADVDDELDEEELGFVQAARGPEAQRFDDVKKETDRK